MRILKYALGIVLYIIGAILILSQLAMANTNIFLNVSGVIACVIHGCSANQIGFLIGALSVNILIIALALGIFIKGRSLFKKS